MNLYIGISWPDECLCKKKERSMLLQNRTNMYQVFVLLAVTVCHDCAMFARNFKPHVTANAITQLYLGPRPACEPYLSGDTIRKYCDFIFDINTQYFDPEVIKKGDIIFVSAHPEVISYFFSTVFPEIKTQVILVTHNSDVNITEKYRAYLDSEKIYAWFAQNVAMQHPKLIHIPIGLENNLWKRHYDRIIKNLINQGIDKQQKNYLLYLNFSLGTNPSERRPLYEYFRTKPFCYCSPRKSIPDYLTDICHSKFALSPHGNGLDCHRTWEILYLGTIPIVKTSSLDPLYQDLPVLIVNEWQEVTEDFLNTMYPLTIIKKYRTEKLYIQHWVNQFGKIKTACINGIPLSDNLFN